MRITNVRGKALELIAAGRLVNPGETIDVPDELGKSLCEHQPANWKKATKSTSPKEGDSE